MNFGLNRILHEESAAVRGVDFDGGGGGGGEREHMFDKVVTPSDVGKLNRLVIPKQHAERFFPLDSSTNDKGLLLNFEDRNGKSWRFRYSYWNSSQSYVMTKGWSRFVKEKRLDAGDIVSFQRGVGEIGRDRLYIDWCRRPELPMDHPHHHHHPAAVLRPSVVVPAAWGSLVWPPFAAAAAGYPAATAARDHQINRSNNSNNSNNSKKIFDWRNEGCCSYGSGVVYLRSSDGRGAAAVAEGNNQVQQEQDYGSGGGGGGGAAVGGGNHEALLQSSSEETVPVMKRSRLRLFGVNMEYCSISSSDESDLLFSTTTSNQNPTTTTKDHS